MLRVSDLDYHLPEGRIAIAPAEPRVAARLMVIDRANAAITRHAHVRDLPSLLRPGDVLIVNASRVIPARLIAQRTDTRGHVEGLYLGQSEHAGAIRWRAMLKAGGRLVPGMTIELLDQSDQPSGVVLKLIDRSQEEGETGAWIIELRPDAASQTPARGRGRGGFVESAPNESSTDTSPSHDHDSDPTIKLLETLGRTPLPPYIRAARKKEHLERPEQRDRDQYQTVYAQSQASPQGSVAAPTAGLHFTPELLATLTSMGVERHEVTLHVGTGTFKPVECECLQDHPMHAEWCTIPRDTCAAIVRARSEGRRIIAVGTTSARTLESFTRAQIESGARGEPCAHWTKILIAPGHRWQNLDALLTNFHLPRSTLLAMVAALLEHEPNTGVPALLAIYREAIAREYRFYSFGDAMLIG
jgi:S-adenosylmethionine:tRNA ribosyltransferase-isomerase